MEKKKIKIGIPKGSLQEHTLKIFESAGFNIQVPTKSYILKIDDPEIEVFMLRPQEIPKYLEEQKLDVGISGEDWIKETKAKVIEICDLKYAKQKIKKVKWVLAVAKKSGIKSIKDLEGKTISTEIINLVKNYLKKKKVKAKIIFSWGATEVKPPRFADAIVDLIETGAALRAHNLKVLDIIFESSTKLIASKEALADAWKKEKINNLAILLKGAVESEKTIGIFMHIPKDNLEKVLGALPSSKKPAVRRVAGTDLCDIFFISDKKEMRELIPKLKRMGCQGIVGMDLNKAVV